MRDYMEKKLFPIRMDAILWGISAILAFLLFQHEDLYATANHAWNLISMIAAGKFFSFYELAADGGPFNAGASYHIFLYILFALWILPLRLANYFFAPGMSGFILIFWCKLLLVLLYFLCADEVRKIARKITEENSTLCAFAWMTSPLAFFAVFLFGQYDIPGLYLMLLAYRKFLDGKLIHFTIICAIAACFKNFSLIFFFPLLLLREKNPWKIALHSAGAVSLAVIVPCIFRMAAPQGGVTQLDFQEKIAKSILAPNFPSGMPGNLFIVFFVLLCFYAWSFAGKENEKGVVDRAVFLPFVSFAGLFLFIPWHIQWLIMLTPWTVFCIFRNKRELDPAWGWIEGVMFVGAAGMVMIRSSGAIDNYMFQLGILPALGSLTPSTSSLAFYTTDYLNKIPEAPVVFGSLFIGSLLLLGGLCRPDAGRTERLVPIRANLYGRFAALLFFVVPAVFCLIKSVSAEKVLFPEGFPKEKVFLFWKNGEKIFVPEPDFFRTPLLTPRMKFQDRISMGEFVKGRVILIPFGNFLSSGLRGCVLPLYPFSTAPSGKTFFTFCDANGKALRTETVENGKVTGKADFIIKFEKPLPAVWLKITSNAQKGHGISIQALGKAGADVPTTAGTEWIPAVKLYPSAW